MAGKGSFVPLGRKIVALSLIPSRKGIFTPQSSETPLSAGDAFPGSWANPEHAERISNNKDTKEEAVFFNFLLPNYRLMSVKIPELLEFGKSSTLGPRNFSPRSLLRG